MKAKSPYLEELRGSMKQGNDGITARMNMKGEIVIEKIPTHYDANTDLQETQRKLFKDTIAQWNALSDQEKEEWREKASPYGLTGYQFFISQNMPHIATYKVTIDNTGGASLSDYQILIAINNDTGFFADCDSKKAAIRIYDSDKTTPLSYWIEEWDTYIKNARIWVKVPSIPADDKKYIYVSIDTSRTEDASDGDATFLFYSDGSDTNWENVQYTTITNNFSDAILENTIRFYNPTNSDLAEARRAIDLGVSKYEMYMKFRTVSLGERDQSFVGIFKDSHSNRYTQIYLPTNDNQSTAKYRVDDSLYVLCSYNEGEVYITKHKVDETDTASGMAYYLYSENYTLLGSAIGKAKAYGSPSGNANYLYVGDGTRYGYVDLRMKYVFFKKYAATEPSISYTKE
ncbi:MAG: hypothetical protein DRP50_05325 [Thermotoga sp.]|nr:MAG: hypothetical protein DRP50_05325 [Thermotoga sp.]